MTICLVIQKDTLENNKVKSVLKVVDENPEDFLNTLQEGHCIPYQLVAYINKNDPVLISKIIDAASNCKTDYGKDWYELDMESLSKVISIFLESSKTFINFPIISSIFGFNFNVFPVVTKEIKITTNDEQLDVVERKDKKEKKEIITLIENLQDEPRRKKKPSSKKE